MTLLLDISSDVDTKKLTLKSDDDALYEIGSRPLFTMSCYISMSQIHRILLRIIVKFISSTFLALDNLSVPRFFFFLQVGICYLLSAIAKVMPLNALCVHCFPESILPIIKNVRQVNED